MRRASAGNMIAFAHLLGINTTHSRSRSSGSPDGSSRADRAAKSASIPGSKACLVAGKSKADRPGNPFRFFHLARAVQAREPDPAPLTQRDAETPDAVARRCLAAAGINVAAPIRPLVLVSRPQTYASADDAARAGLKAAGIPVENQTGA